VLEFNDAVAYLELEQKGLGLRFKSDVKDALGRIVKWPQGWVRERKEIRRCLLRTFPYKILYSLEDDHIFVIAIAHQHRRPNYWVGERSSEDRREE